MALNKNFGVDDLTPYQVNSRREIVTLLRALQERKQILTMHADGGADAVITTVLEVEDESGIVVIDRASSNVVNQRMLEGENIAFETVLDNIRILFFAARLSECIYGDLPALCIDLPTSVVRLQRREHYRVPTPIANPLRCTIQIPREDGNPSSTIVVPLQNVSGGGIAIVDEKRLLNNTIGHIYKDCRIDLPGGTLVVATLQIRNCYDSTLPNGKTSRRIGCLFVDLPKPMLAAVQRYITKLEREQNAKATGMK
jgi:c-di-GMP-binding flagellar brake protein YcgR